MSKDNDQEKFCSLVEADFKKYTGDKFQQSFIVYKAIIKLFTPKFGLQKQFTEYLRFLNRLLREILDKEDNYYLN
ncbi:MAG: hypothetical protein ACFFDC_01000 [Promethearchaeota archaeon]